MSDEKNSASPQMPVGDGGTAKNKERFELYDWVQCIVTSIVVCVLIFTFVGRVIGVKGSSMFDTLCNGDKVIASSLLYTPSQFDVVVVRTESEYFKAEPLVKRIIATEGQTVNIDFAGGIVYIDGEPLDEPYAYAPTYEPEDFDGPITVPEGCVFVMGDNRNASTDSRSDKVGFIDVRDILGKVYFVIIPGVDANGSRDWSRLGLVH